MLRLRVLGVAALLFAAFVASSPPASAAAVHPPVYLALGDSIAYGVGAEPPTNGYVPVLHGLLTAMRPCGAGQAVGCGLDLQNLAVSGATTDTLISDQLGGAASLAADRNGNPSPVDDVTLITLDIGGNDLVGPVISACSVISPSCVATIQSQLQHVNTNLAGILSALRSAAGPGTVIAVMTYYNSFQACTRSALSPLAELVLEGGGPIPAGLNTIIRNQAAAYHAVVAETKPLITRDDLVGGSDCLHPNNAGHTKIARAFDQVIDAAAVIGPPGRR
jgi:lysophospholipase L1-like esterase